jgi:hypothetical protein
MLVGLVVALGVSFQQITQPDYNTHRKAPPGEWLWVVIPGLGFAALLAWRMLRTRVETSEEGLRVVRVLGGDEVPWSEVQGFEVRPTPNRGGFRISARHTNLRITPLGTIPGRSEKRRAQAEAFAAELDTERVRCSPSAAAGNHP